MTEELVRAPCSACKRETRHSKLCESTASGDPNDYHYFESHEVIECRGCGRKSFRHLYLDIESAYPNSEDEWETPEDIKFYPKVDLFEIIDKDFLIPNDVGNIYKETMSAIREEALTLAGLGLRGTIEAICNERSISGRNLDVRISRLASQGLISTKDASRLHGIRFLGNDAAHEIKRPSKNQISVAVSIINHLLKSIYILDEEVDGTLDTIVTEPDHFKRLLTGHLKQFNAGDEYPLAKFLGRDVRRLGGGASGLEHQLLAEISAGTYDKLSVGKLDNFAGSQSAVQHFIVL